MLDILRMKYRKILIRKTIFITTIILIVTGCTSVVEKTDDGQGVFRSSIDTLIDAKATHCELIWQNSNFAGSYIRNHMFHDNSLKNKYQVAQKVDPKRAEAIKQEGLNSLRQKLKKSNDYYKGMLIYGEAQLPFGKYNKDVGGFKLNRGLYRNMIVQESFTKPSFGYWSVIEEYLSDFYAYRYSRPNSHAVVWTGNISVNVDVPIYTKGSRGITYIDQKKAFYLKMPYEEAKAKINAAINAGEQIVAEVHFFYEINRCKEFEGKSLLYGQVTEAHFYDLKRNKLKNDKIFSWYLNK